MCNFGEIVEIVPTGSFRANQYLEHGYRLLSIVRTNHAKTRADGQLFIHNRVTYVMGRTVEVDHWQPEWQPELEGEPQAAPVG